MTTVRDRIAFACRAAQHTLAVYGSRADQGHFEDLCQHGGPRIPATQTFEEATS